MVWHSTFHVGRTHPLNQVKYISWGISPQNNTDQFKTAINVANSHDCRHNDTEDLIHDEINYTYCDELQCVFRDECNTYKAGTGIDQVSSEISDIVESAIETAERMTDGMVAGARMAGAIELMEAMRDDAIQAEAEMDDDLHRDGEPDVDEGYRRIEEDNETPEERVIRWAAARGGAINIGER